MGQDGSKLGLEAQVEAFKNNRKDTSIPENGLLTAKDYKRIQKQIMFEYPEVASLKESMLLTDHRVRDQPIVYCNDFFERMTLYPKDVILGVNCRFLQGPLTDKGVVREIREAIAESRPLDVEILNYRRDGVPFWNIFILLPLHKQGKTTGDAEFYLAVQKDVSLIKGLKKDVNAWSAPEVCMYLERRNLTYAVQKFLDERIEGRQLLEIDDLSLLHLGFKMTKDRERILNAIAEDFKDGEYLEATKTTKTTRLNSSSSDAEEQKTLSRNQDELIKGIDIWGENVAITGERITVKCKYGKREPRVFLIDHPNNLDEFKLKIFERLGRKFEEITCVDPEGDVFEVASDDDLEVALLLAEDNSTLNINVKKRGEIYDTSINHETVAVPVICVDVYQNISQSNAAARDLFGVETEKEMLKKSISNLFEDWEGSTRVHKRNGETINAKINNEEKKPCKISVNLQGYAVSVLTIIL